MLPEDLALLVGQALGVEMVPACAARLYSHLSNSELAEALAVVDARASGTKEERIDRLVAHKVQPRAVLRQVSLETLRTICRNVNAAVSGSKEELVERIVAQFAARLDLPVPEAPPRAPVCEVRALEEQRFRALFYALRGSELSEILTAFPELRQSGSKELRAATLWASHRSEATLLLELSNRKLEDILIRLELKIAGSKRERVDRLIHHFATFELAALRAAGDATAAEDD